MNTTDTNQASEDDLELIVARISAGIGGFGKLTSGTRYDGISEEAGIELLKKQIEQAYSDGFQKASKGALKSQQEAKREAVEAVLDRLEKRVKVADATERYTTALGIIEAERNKLKEIK